MFVTKRKEFGNIQKCTIHVDFILDLDVFLDFYCKIISVSYIVFHAYNNFCTFTVINDNYEHLDALAACFPWCTTAGSRLSLSRGLKCETYMLFAWFFSFA